VRALLRSLPLAAALVLLTSSVASATSYTDTIDGFEYFATSTSGFFHGTADGALPGWFDTRVDHTVLSPDATITGGYFVLSTTMAGEAAFINGGFTGGTVVQTDRNTHGCRDQHYAVTGTLGGVTVNGGGSGSGSFNATLTHFRQRIGGSCVTYWATITGTVTLAI
jgi:hypothetical protein